MYYYKNLRAPLGLVKRNDVRMSEAIPDRDLYVCDYGNEIDRRTAWRERVLLRYELKCCVTGEEHLPELLDTHHLWAWAVFPNVKFNVLNGRPMLRTLHKSYHSGLRGKPATPASLIEFIQRESGRTLEGLYVPRLSYYD